MEKAKANPVFTNYENNYQNESIMDEYIEQSATIKGVTIKTAILLIVAVLSGVISSLILYSNSVGLLSLLLVLLAISGMTSFICVLIGMRKPGAAMPCGIIYSIGEGLSLGLLCTIVNLYMPGIVPAAVGILVVIFATMLTLYATGVLRAGRKIQAFVLTVLISYIVISLIGLVLGLFGVTFIMDMLNFGPIAILVAALLVIVGAFMLLTDFAEAERIVKSGCDKRFEWIAAFGLMVSIVFLFVQIIRLLILIAGSRKD